MNNSHKEGAPSLAADAPLSNIESALLRGVVDVRAEIDRRFPRRKPPTYAKRWRELARLLQKERLYNQALTAVDRLRRESSAPVPPVPEPRVTQANGNG